MIRCRRSLFVLALVLFAVPPAAAKTHHPKNDPAEAHRLLQKARTLWYTDRDYNGALDAFNRAVAVDPGDDDILIERGFFLEFVSGVVVDKDKEKFRVMARKDFAAVAKAEPDSIRGGVARDGLTRLSGRTLLPPASVSCPPDAVEAYDRAENLFGAGRFDDAVADYAKAAAACPASGAILVDYADAYYQAKRYEKAEGLFRKALAVDPWNRAGHRYLADTEARLGHVDAALHQAALAVVSDPVYEAAWASVRNMASHSGRAWRRVYGEKPGVAVGAGDAKNTNVTISLPPGDSDHETKKPKKKGASKKDAGKGPSDDSTCWITYAMTKAVILGGTVIEDDGKGGTIEKKVDPKTLSALEIERDAARAALAVARESPAADADAAHPFWSMMDRADKAGYLDEAIFLHMLDGPLAAEYPAFRDAHEGRLVSYIETVIVPKQR